MALRIQINQLSPEQFLRLYTSVGREPPGIEQIRKALANTLAAFTAYDEDTPVGVVRLIGDGPGMFKMLSDMPFYERLGFTKDRHFTFYRKNKKDI